MPIDGYEINEGGGSYVDLRGVRGSGTVRLSCHQLHGLQKGVLLSQKRLPDLSESEACDLRLPIPPMPAGKEYVLLVELDSGTRQDTLMPAPDENIHLKVVPRAYVDDKEEAWPPEPLNGFVVAVRDATGDEIAMNVVGPAGEHAGPASTNVLAAGLAGPPGPIPRHRTRQHEGRTEIQFQIGGESNDPVWGDWLPLEGDPGPPGEGMQDTGGATITDEWLLTKLPAAQITGAPAGGDYPIRWPEGTAGTYSIERDSDGNPKADVHTHEASGATVTRPVLRGEDGRAIGYDTPQITRA